MKRIVFLILAFIVASTFASCKEKTKEVVEAKYPDGSPKEIGYYKVADDTLILMRSIKYYPNHNKKEEGKYKEGKRHGKWTVWYDNGNLWSEGEFKKGIREGAAVTYFEDGTKRYEGKYKNDKETGKWKFYDPKGQLVKTVDFDQK